MKWLLLILLTLAFGSCVAWLIIYDESYVNITIGNQQLFENNITVFALLLVAVIFAVFFVLKTLMAVFNAPDILSTYHYERKHKAAQEHLKQGFIDFIECDWSSAEKHFIKGADYSDTPLLNYLGAARAAGQQSKFKAVEKYIEQARLLAETEEPAILLTQAEIALNHQQPEKAISILESLKGLKARHPYVMKLESRLYYQLKDWKNLATLLPKIKKNKLFKPEQLDKLELETGRGLISTANTQLADESLTNAWQSLPSMLRKDTRIISVYVAALMGRGDYAQAEMLTQAALDKNWSETLIEQYGELKVDHTDRLLEQCERWLKDYPESPNLLLSMARLCIKEKRFDEADDYYERSLNIAPSAAVKIERAGLLESMGRTDQAALVYKESNRLLLETN